MRWILYNVLFLIGFTLLLPRHLCRMWRRGGYGRGFSQRFGRLDAATRSALSDGGRTWIHAVSVGELFVALGFIEAFRKRDPKARFLVTVTTSTAHRIAQERFTGGADVLLYFPIDLVPIQRRLMRLARPKALLLVEGELWPNLIRTASAHGVFIGIINGRLSASSHRGYRALSFFSRPLLSRIDCACMQTEADRDRLVDLGVDPARAHVCGSAKYDAAQTDPTAEKEARSLLHAAGFPRDALLLLGGSTWPGEEAALLDLYRQLKPGVPRLALGLAPRHIERLRDVEAEIEKRGLVAVRRTGARPPATSPDVFLLDTTGELRRFYAGADVIFIGKSLTARGGQNPIEAAAWDKPVLCGPHMENFPVIMEDLIEADAILQADDAGALSTAVRRLLGAPEERAALGRRAGEEVRRRMGAVDRTLDLLKAAGARI